jgi:hypothetical protein
VQCQQVTPSSQLTGAQPTCPKCGGNQFTPALDETGEPIVDQKPIGRGVTTPHSPLEVAFPFSYPRFDDIPYLIRLGWLDRYQAENDARMQDQVEKIKWQKSPSERSMQVFRSLPLQNDLGTAPFTWSSGPSTTESEGISEYELWYKPCSEYPDGLVLRVLGDDAPLVLHLEDSEGLPGSIPYHDAEGNPLFTWAHAAYEHVGGRILGSGAIDPVIQKQDQLNQLDSMVQLIIQRMANPIWSIPKGSEVEQFVGEPGWVMRWNPLTVGGNAEPKRIDGKGPDASFFELRQQYKTDIEELMGTFDIIKGEKPTGVEAFSALQLLVERSQARFASAFQARGDLYRRWSKFSLELEREFGPEQRTRAILTPARTYAFKVFKNAQLQGSISAIVEDGTTAPKTNLGMRATVDHANQLGLLNLRDPDQQYEGLKLFGLTKMVPSLDVHVQAALQNQQAFEEWLQNPQAMMESATRGVSPLRYRKWYNPIIHRQELLKWANSDKMREAFAQQPAAEGLVEAYLAEIDLAIMQTQAGMMDVGGEVIGAGVTGAASGSAGPGKQPGGAGAAMSNSNRESAELSSMPSGSSERNQGQGPA